MIQEDTLRTHDVLEEATGTAPFIYTYPFGLVCNEAADALEVLDYKVFLSCREIVNELTGYTPGMTLGRFNRPNGISSAEFFKKIET